MAGNLDIVHRGRIIGMWESGICVRDIARRIPCSEFNVRKWIKRWQEEGAGGLRDRREHNRRQRLTTAEEDALLVNQVDSNPFLPVSHSVNQLDLQISDRTAQRRLHKANVHCYRVARKIALTSKHRDNRVAFALHQINTASSED